MSNSRTAKRELEHAKACFSIIKQGSKSFHFASMILPRNVRMAATSLYAFCRVSDDLVDDPRATFEAVNKLRHRLDAAYRGEPFNHVADRAFAEVVEAYNIPKTVPLSMIEGFEWDLADKQYDTIGEVIDYSARVAGTVGIMMSLVMDRRSERTLARACDLGVAMQLINISRDVGEDARNGRVYLPNQWLREAGTDREELLHDPRHSQAVALVIERLLDTADEIYQRALTGLSDLPRMCRPGIRAAGMVYAGIGTQVRANNYNSIDHRAYTTKSQKLGLLVKALRNDGPYGSCDESPALTEVNYLVRAAADPELDPRGSLEWLIDLNTKLARRDRGLNGLNSRN